MLLTFLLFLHFTLAAALISGITRLALISWSKAKGTHWTERARLLWPMRKADALLVLAVPGSLAAAQSTLLPDLPATDLYAALAGIPGGILGLWPVACAVFPGISFARWLRDLTCAFIIRVLLAAVWIAAWLIMPSRLDWTATIITVAVVAFTLWLMAGGMVWLLRVTRLLQEAPPRLAGVVTAVAARMDSPLPRVWLLHGFGANAMAFPAIQTLVVTDEAAKALSDEELGAVCAHEFAHLHEPRGVVAARVLSAFALLPGLFFKAASAAWGLSGYFAIVAAVFLLARLITAFRRRMEKRADSVATVHEGVLPGTYAQALERLYEINQVPAVISGLLTHPNLYDRLLAAGVTPSYSRPAAPPKFTWPRTLAILLLVASAVIVVTRIKGEDWSKRHSAPAHYRRSDLGVG